MSDLSLRPGLSSKRRSKALRIPTSTTTTTSSNRSVDGVVAEKENARCLPNPLPHLPPPSGRKTKAKIGSHQRLDPNHEADDDYHRYLLGEIPGHHRTPQTHTPSSSRSSHIQTHHHNHNHHHHHHHHHHRIRSNSIHIHVPAFASFTPLPAAAPPPAAAAAAPPHLASNVTAAATDTTQTTTTTSSSTTPPSNTLTAQAPPRQSPRCATTRSPSENHPKPPSSAAAPDRKSRHSRRATLSVAALTCFAAASTNGTSVNPNPPHRNSISTASLFDHPPRPSTSESDAADSKVDVASSPRRISTAAAPPGRSKLAPFYFRPTTTTTPDTISLRKQKKSTSTESLLDSSDNSQLRGNEPVETTVTRQTNKMHQTSSRLLRMTDDDRPFTRDFKDLFSTLIVSLPLSTHRFRFKTYPFSFASEEAINNLGSLKFSQSNRMPDPKDPSRIVTTTTTTTFSMAKEMARSVCQRFMDARFIELADGKSMPVFPLKGCLWQLTPKGIHILERFCQRNGIQQEHVLKLLNSPYNTMRLVILERDPKTDKLSQDKFTTEVLFRRFVGTTPNVKASTSISDNDSVSDYQDGVTGVKLADSRKIYDKVIKMSFTGKCAVDWLLDCCTTVERAETYEVCTMFVQHGLIQSVLEDRVYIQQNPAGKDFQPTKNAVYIITDKGKRVAGWLEAERVSLGERSTDGTINSTARSNSAVRNHSPRGHTDQRETNTTRLQAILNDPALRLLYREFLRETVCEENLTFYLDVTAFNENFNSLDLSKPDAVRETLAAAYGLYNAFLAPGSPCELNIDHPLRQDMASRMTRAVARDDTSMYTSLKEVAALFDRAQSQVFKLMAGDSVPKFIRTQKYIEVAGDILDDERLASGGSMHRSASRGAR